MSGYTVHHLQASLSVTGLVNISYYKLPTNFSWPGESHDFWEMVYVDRGELLVQAGENEYLLRAGEIAFHCPNEFHSLRIFDGKAVNIVVVSFHCSGSAMAKLEHTILPLNRQEKQLMSLMLQEAEDSFLHFDNIAPAVDLSLRQDAPSNCQQMMKNLLECFLITVTRREGGILFNTRGVSINRSHHHAQIAERLMEYMHQHYPEKITLDSLASMENISVSLLKQIFKEQTGDTVISYLTKYRIGEAKRLIQESNMNFSQIALAVGYDGICYFSTLFKKHTGMTPSEFARSLRRS